LVVNSTGNVGSLVLPSAVLLLTVALYFVPGTRLSSGIAVLSAGRDIFVISPVSVFSKETSTVSIPGLEVEYDNEAVVSSTLSTVTFCGGGTIN